MDSRVKSNKPEHFRRWVLKTKYGLTRERYYEMCDEQEGVCAICYRPESRKRRGEPLALSVDHDHDSGVVRGLLCCSCNTMLGLAQDSVHILDRAIRYLANSGNVHPEGLTLEFNKRGTPVWKAA